jgi:Icc-related predicted phosphoesterase
MKNNKISITLISDTHNKHTSISDHLPGGDLLIFAGDIMGSGYKYEEVSSFCEWMNSLDQYATKIFIAGNHDRIFETSPDEAKLIVDQYPNIRYLQDESGFHFISSDPDRSVSIYGSPWQPWFYNWAFNLHRNSEELKSKWDAIPEGTEILVTHGPAFGYLDTVEGRRHENLGCELLVQRIKEIKPKIHVCGHIHSGYGYVFDGETHFFNASVLDERYTYTQKPFVFDWYPETNEIFFPE